jgi:hypothetical protein
MLVDSELYHHTRVCSECLRVSHYCRFLQDEVCSP